MLEILYRSLIPDQEHLPGHRHRESPGKGRRLFPQHVLWTTKDALGESDVEHTLPRRMFGHLLYSDASSSKTKLWSIMYDQCINNMLCFLHSRLSWSWLVTGCREWWSFSTAALSQPDTFLRQSFSSFFYACSRCSSTIRWRTETPTSTNITWALKITIMALTLHDRHMTTWVQIMTHILQHTIANRINHTTTQIPVHRLTPLNDCPQQKQLNGSPQMEAT